MREKRVILEYGVDASLVRLQIRYRPAIQQDVAGCRRFETGDETQRRGLAASGGPQEREKFASSESERYSANRPVGWEMLGKSPQLQNCVHVSKPDSSARDYRRCG